MTDLDLTKLREIANAATPGDWTADIHNTRRRSPRTRRWLQWKPEHGTHGYVSIVESDGAYGVLDGPDALHVATFDPPTVLALIDEIERLRAQVDEVAERAWDRAVGSIRYEDGSPVEIVFVTNPYRTKEVMK